MTRLEVVAAGLAQIERELQAALVPLETASRKCGACGVSVYDNLAHHRAADAILGALGRVRRARELIVEAGADGAQGAKP